MSKIRYFKLEDATHVVGPGEYIFKVGQAGNCAYVLLEGQAEIIIGDAVVERAEPGGLLGEMALVEHRPRSASARAVTGCKLIEIDERRFLFLVQQHPFFALEVMKIMAERLRHMNQELSRMSAGGSGPA